MLDARVGVVIHHQDLQTAQYRRARDLRGGGHVGSCSRGSFRRFGGERNGEDRPVPFARALGQTSDRLVSWHTEALVEYLAGAAGSGPEDTLERLDELLDDLEELLLYAWRRHLAAKDEAFGAPATTGVRFHDIFTVWIAGSGGYDSIINGTGAPATSTNPGKVTPVDLPSYP